jgi:hypothetical protein
VKMIVARFNRGPLDGREMRLPAPTDAERSIEYQEDVERFPDRLHVYTGRYKPADRRVVMHWRGIKYTGGAC